jgi:hypothetical protein
MSDNAHNFHQFALKSILFKGRNDWYFSFLKSERIAHVLVLLAASAPHPDLDELVSQAKDVPQSIVFFAAGEVTTQVLLAEVFAIMSSLRLAGANGLVRQENIVVIVDEYQKIAQTMGGGNHPSPFVTPEDFALPLSLSPQVAPQRLVLEQQAAHPILKDTRKGHTKKPIDTNKKAPQDQNSRTETILEFVLKSTGVSIKDISNVVRDCSEKTIQRELAGLIQRGLIKKVGERRWSLYLPASL